MPPSELSRAIADEDWPRVTQLAKECPHQAKVWSKRHGFFDGITVADVLPLHEALVAHAPLECIVAIADAYPNGLRKRESSYLRLPLHCGCRKNATPDVIEALTERNRDACLEPDKLERLPIHYALSNGADPETISILLEYGPTAVRGSDHRGWSPAHVAVHLGAEETLVKALLDAYPEVVLTKTNRGHSIHNVIAKHARNRQELAELVKEFNEAVQESIHLPRLRRKSINPDQMNMI